MSSAVIISFLGSECTVKIEQNTSSSPNSKSNSLQIFSKNLFLSLVGYTRTKYSSSLGS